MLKLDCLRSHFNGMKRGLPKSTPRINKSINLRSPIYRLDRTTSELECIALNEAIEGLRFDTDEFKI